MTTTTRRVTRLDREEAAAAAGDPIDLAPVGRIAGVVAVALVVAIAASIFVPGSTRFGGPLQDGNLVAGATMTPVRKAGDGVVTIGVFVPWNAGDRTVVLEGIEPLGVDGEVEVVETALLPSGAETIEPVRGLPEDAPVLFALEDAPIEPGGGPLDSAQLAVSLRGEGSVLGFLLRYRVEGARHDAILMSGAMVCERACKGRGAVAERQRAFARVVVGYVDAPSR